MNLYLDNLLTKSKFSINFRSPNRIINVGIYDQSEAFYYLKNHSGSTLIRSDISSIWKCLNDWIDKNMMERPMNKMIWEGENSTSLWSIDMRFVLISDVMCH